MIQLTHLEVEGTAMESMEKAAKPPVSTTQDDAPPLGSMKQLESWARVLGSFAVWGDKINYVDPLSRWESIVWVGDSAFCKHETTGRF